MDIKKSEKFLPVNLIPVLSPQDTISDAIDAMREKNTRVIILANDADRWDIWLNEIASYCADNGPVTPWMVTLGTVMEEVSPSETFEIEKYSGGLDLLLDKERAVMITEGGNLIGIATSDNQALWSPAVFECVQGHLFFPPIPKTCPYDGTMIG